MGSNMGTMTNEERERRILAMEEELRLLKGQSPQSSNFPGFAPLCTPVGGVSLAGSEATQGPRLNEPKQKLEMGGSRHDHDRWLVNGQLYLEANGWLTNAQHVAYFTCQHVGSSLWPIFRAKLQAGDFADWNAVEAWVRSLQPQPNYDVLDRLERLSQRERPVIEYLSEFDTVLAEMPLDITLDDRLLFRTFRKGLDQALILLLAGHPEWNTYTAVRTKVLLLEEYAMAAGNYRPRSQKNKRPVAPSATVATAGANKPQAKARPWQRGKQGSKPQPSGQKGQKPNGAGAGRNGRDAAAGACFYCHQKGHIRANCPQLRKGPQAHAVEVAKGPKKGFPLVINAVEIVSDPAESHPVKRVLAFEPPQKRVPDSPGTVEADTLSQLLGGLYPETAKSPECVRPVTTPTELEVVVPASAEQKEGPSWAPCQVELGGDHPLHQEPRLARVQAHGRQRLVEMALLYQKDLSLGDLMNPNFWYKGNPIHWGWFRRFAESLVNPLIRERIAELGEAVPTTCPRWLWDCLGHRFLKACYGLRAPDSVESAALLKQREVSRRSKPQPVVAGSVSVSAVPVSKPASGSGVLSAQQEATASPTSSEGSGNSCEKPAAYSDSPWDDSLVITQLLDARHPDPLQWVLSDIPECGASLELAPESETESETWGFLNPAEHNNVTMTNRVSSVPEGDGVAIYDYLATTEMDGGSLMVVKLKLGSIQCRALLDTGASINIVSTTVWDQLMAGKKGQTESPLKYRALPVGSEGPGVRMADGTYIPHSGKRVEAPIILDDRVSGVCQFDVLPLGNYDVILGMPWFRSCQPRADFARHLLWVRIGKEHVCITCEQTTKADLASAKLPPSPDSCQTESVRSGEDILSFGELQTMLRAW